MIYSSELPPFIKVDGFLLPRTLLSSEKYSSELVKKYVRREMLMNSPLFEEWVKEEREEAAKKAREEATRRATIKTKKESIIDVLSERFDFVPEKIIEGINNIESLTILNQLFKRSIKTSSLDEFSKLLEIIIQG